MDEKELKELRLKIKNYMELDNVSFLVGAGATYHLGGVTIRNFPKSVEEEIPKELQDTLLKTVVELQGVDSAETIKRDGADIATPYETLLNYLTAQQFMLSLKRQEDENLDDLIRNIKEALFNLCDVDALDLHEDYKKDENLQKNKYAYHEQFMKKVLQRPLNLRRANVFTVNYDLALEYAFDNLAIRYIDGFSGFHRRAFKPETFEYDIFYPGSTTIGKVHRSEKVIKYFKLHGSLSWVQTDVTPGNIYGIQELPLELIKSTKRLGDLIIYPCSTKKSFTLDLPYSELFRQFSSAIMLNQSVLMTLGYSFGDEHINDIIRQALSIPSFTLIIVDYLGNKVPAIGELVALDDPRVMLVEGDEAKFTSFVQNILPDLYESRMDEKVAETLQKLNAQGEGEKEE